MTPDRFIECLAYICWTPSQLAYLLECDISLVMAWAEGKAQIPEGLAIWLNSLAQAHAAFGIPATFKGRKHKRHASIH